MTLLMTQSLPSCSLDDAAMAVGAALDRLDEQVYITNSEPTVLVGPFGLFRSEHDRNSTSTNGLSPNISIIQIPPGFSERGSGPGGVEFASLTGNSEEVNHFASSSSNHTQDLTNGRQIRFENSAESSSDHRRNQRSRNDETLLNSPRSRDPETLVETESIASDDDGNDLVFSEGLQQSNLTNTPSHGSIPSFPTPHSHASEDFNCSSRAVVANFDLQSSNDTRFLLNHYASHLVHLTSPVEVFESPWQSIGLDKALNAFAHLWVFGELRRTSLVLLYSLLAISAHHVAVVYKGPRTSPTTGPSGGEWTNMAHSYDEMSKSETSLLLKENRISPWNEDERTEFLMALIMTTAKGVSGHCSISPISTG